MPRGPDLPDAEPIATLALVASNGRWSERDLLVIARISLDELEGFLETLTSQTSEMLKHKGIRLTRRMREDRNSCGQSRQKANSQMVCPILLETTP